ncbi:MAG: Na(+)-translocating NADH-quinone reductase subunit A [Mucinivorans sp.]
MSKIIKIKKGVNISLVGQAEKMITKSATANLYALVPSQFMGVTPKMLVQQGDRVKIGQPIFFDKEHTSVLFTSPVAGTIQEIVRGDKRKIMAITIAPDGTKDSVEFAKLDSNSPIELIRQTLLDSGLWPSLIQRPFGFIAATDVTPRDIFITGIDTAPLAADLNFLVQDESANVSRGVEILSRLTSGKVHLTVGFETTAGTLANVKSAEIHHIQGPHPAGNVGTQIAAIAPISKGDIVWTIGIQHVAMIGRLAATGHVDFSKLIALSGSMVKKPHYYRTICGAPIASIVEGNLKDGTIRLINGNPLSGTKVDPACYVSYYANEVVALPEGDNYEFLGWAMPRCHKLSLSKSYFSWLTPHKNFDLDTNLNGGVRALVVNDIYNRVMPLDIYPVYLLKAIMADDIDKMENLGIYEVLEEDFALCEFVCPSKIEWQYTLRQGINKMIKEL